MSTEILASEQFARDIRLVLDNDYMSYELIQAAAKGASSTYELAEFIRTYTEQCVVSAMGAKRDSAGALLIMQLCTGWGVDPYMRIAAEIKQELSESAGV